MEGMIASVRPYSVPKGDGTMIKESEVWGAKKGRHSCRRVLLPGVWMAVLILGLTITLAALLISENKIKLERGVSAVNLLYAAAILAGCFLTAKRAKQGKLLWAGLTAALSGLIVLAVSFTMPEFSAGGLGRMLAVTVLAWLSGGLLGARKKRNGYL